jgi:hypothetical protein
MWVLVLAVALGVGHSFGPGTGQAPIQAELSVGDSFRVPGRALSITFVRVVSDSRCPTGVTCVWEGDAAIAVRVTGDAVEPETLELHTADASRREGTAQGARIRLDRLEPLPAADRPPGAGDYRAFLSVFVE